MVLVVSSLVGSELKILEGREIERDEDGDVLAIPAPAAAQSDEDKRGTRLVASRVVRGVDTRLAP